MKPTIDLDQFAATMTRIAIVKLRDIRDKGVHRVPLGKPMDRGAIYAVAIQILYKTDWDSEKSTKNSSETTDLD